MENDFKEKNVLMNTSNYKDRKMTKWNGFILSEHTEQIKKVNKHLRKVNEPRPKQTEQEISNYIYNSFRQKRPISIQMDILFNGLYEDDLVGIVTGFEAENIYIQTNDETIFCDIILIRNIQENQMVKWFKEDFHG